MADGTGDRESDDSRSSGSSYSRAAGSRALEPAQTRSWSRGACLLGLRRRSQSRRRRHGIGNLRFRYVDELQLIEPLIGGRREQQVLMAADGGDAAVLKNRYAMSAANGGQPMRDDHDGAVLHKIGERGLHQRFALRI